MNDLIDGLTLATGQEFRDQIVRVEAELKESIPVDQREDYEINHHFCDGQYAREMLLPAGHRIIGKIHRHSHVNVISMGIVDVWTDEGYTRYEAPITFISKAGVKRLVIPVTNAIWTTIHLAENDNLEQVEAEVIAPTFDDVKRLDK